MQGRHALLVILGLSVSILIGAYYLVFNDHLWLTATSHAYALIGFITVDCIFIAFLIARKTRIGFIGALAIASIQAAAMFVDIYSYQDIPVFAVTDSNFEDMLEHTYGTWSFDLLLATQLWIIAMSIIGMRKVGIESRPTRKQVTVIPIVLVGVAALLAVFPLGPIYEKQEWVYVHGVGWQAPESFRNKDIGLADLSLPINGTMVLQITHPLYVEGTISMKVPCTEEAKSLVTVYTGTRINLHMLKMNYVKSDSDPPIYCAYNAKFPQGDYIVNFIGLENTSGEHVIFSEEHKISIRLTKIEGEIPAHASFGR